MAAKTSKAKSKHRPPTKAKAKRAASKPLLARSADVRRAKPASRRRVAAVVPVALTGNPALVMFNVMGRVIQAYAELPGRLAQCRSPFDVWREQVRFAQRLYT
jgi:hypothetical protein